jgi:hypothetical protein
MNIVITEQQYRLILEQRSDAAMDAQAKAISNLPSDYKHNLVTVLGIAASFVPVVGPLLAFGIGLADASAYYREGDKKGAALVAVLSAIPGIKGLAATLGLSKWSVKAMAVLAKKMSVGSALTPLEMSVVNKIAENKNLISTEINKLKSSPKTKPPVANSVNSKTIA